MEGSHFPRQVRVHFRKSGYNSGEKYEKGMCVQR